MRQIKKHRRKRSDLTGDADDSNLFDPARGAILLRTSLVEQLPITFNRAVVILEALLKIRQRSKLFGFNRCLAVCGFDDPILYVVVL